MFPFRYRSLFRSRWIALMWAIGMCWTAVEVAGWGGGDPPSPADGNSMANQASPPSQDDDLARLENQVHAFEAGR